MVRTREWHEKHDERRFCVANERTKRRACPPTLCAAAAVAAIVLSSSQLAVGHRSGIPITVTHPSYMDGCLFACVCVCMCAHVLCLLFMRICVAGEPNVVCIAKQSHHFLRGSGWFVACTLPNTQFARNTPGHISRNKCNLHQTIHMRMRMLQQHSSLGKERKHKRVYRVQTYVYIMLLPVFMRAYEHCALRTETI